MNQEVNSAYTKNMKIFVQTARFIARELILKGSSAGIVFSHGQIFGFFTPHGRHVVVRSSLPNFTLIGSGVWDLRPQKLKKFGILPI